MATFTLLVLNPRREPLGGTVDIVVRSETGMTMSLRGADASREIPVLQNQDVPPGVYHISVTVPGGGSTESRVTVGREGPFTFTIVVRPADGRDANASLKGRLSFDHGLPADGVLVRLYSIGFAGADRLIGETTSDAHGEYAFSYPLGPQIQVRVVDSAGSELAISTAKCRPGVSDKLNLIVPGRVKPVASEFDRLAADVGRISGGMPALGRAQETAARRDLTLLSCSTNWDARLIALAVAAARQVAAVNLPPESTQVFYALYRAGLPTDSQALCRVPAATARAALEKAVTAGIVTMNGDQIANAARMFETFATQTRLELKTAGAPSTFGELFPANISAAEQTAFTTVYFDNPTTGPRLWDAAAAAGVSAPAIEAMKRQGKFLYLTYNSAPLAKKLQQDLGATADLAALVDKDYYLADTWKAALTAAAGSNTGEALDRLIPSTYRGATREDRVDAYAADLARKVRISFPTQVTARMVESNQIPLDQGTAVAAALKAAAPLGYKLGQTPLHAFLRESSAQLPQMDRATTNSLERLHRLYQVTPGSEALAAAAKAGVGSAYEITAQPYAEFTEKYAGVFGSVEHAGLIYRKAQQVSSVTFNVFSMAKQLDTAPPVYGMSAPDLERQNAKDALVQQFPSMADLFGSLDFCQCDDCRSVLSPAAYFVDLLEFLRKSAANAKGYTPLDVLIGKDNTVPGRRPDLAALPLTCENTNTALPYIDLVNEILEYFIAHKSLDGGVAYDTGPASTADLSAEPQHTLAQVYSATLKKAVYPINLPFDLWIETVRGFLDYFKSSLADVLDTMRPVDRLELFTDADAHPYYRAQILAESLALTPAEYDVLTAFPPGKWFELYGYTSEAAALAALPSAKTLAGALTLTYQELTDLVTTGFLNPALSAIVFQLRRFALDFRTAFAYTGQPGYPALSAAAKTAFEAQLAGITARYKLTNPASTFDAITWLNALLPANYSKKVLILRDPDTGCNFTSTTLQYADGSAATPLDFLKVNLFVRLWKRLRWTMDETDRSLQAFFPKSLPAWGAPTFPQAFGAAWKTALTYCAHLDELNTQLSPATRTALLPLWGDISTGGVEPPYADLFLGPGVLANDWAFDDPSGVFPWTTTDPLASHQTTIQGVFGLSDADVAAILLDADAIVTKVAGAASFSLANISLCYRYSLLARALELPVADLIALKVFSSLNPFPAISASAVTDLAGDVVHNQTLTFLTAARSVATSGFTVEDLRYLLRHQFDPVGKYQVDTNALSALVQSVANGLRQIRIQNTVPARLASQPETLTDQRLSALFPAAILKSLFAQLSDAQTYTATQSGVAAANAIDPAPFAGEDRLTFAYDAVTQIQTVTCRGVLLDWQRDAWLQINGTPLFTGLLAALQKQAPAVFAVNVGNVLGVWASLARYEALTPAAAGIAAGPLAVADAALTLRYDSVAKRQWLDYRGVLTDAKKTALTAIDSSATFTSLLNNVQGQAMPAYRELVGAMLSTVLNGLTFQASQSPVTPANRIDAAVFAPFRQLQLTYDEASQTQTLRYQGALADADRIALAALLPGSSVLSGLLQSVRNAALATFTALAADLLTVTAADLDTFSTPFRVDGAQPQKVVKAALVTVFLPLLAQKLSRDFIVNTLAANLAADPALIGFLITTGGLLTDPADSGRAILETFLSAGNQGVSATYWITPDQSGAVLAAGIQPAVDTAGQPTARSARFEGYLQVPVDGPYRFFGQLGNLNAAVALRIDPPDPTTLLDNPILSPSVKAAKDHDEVSQFVQLRGGALYYFTADFTALGPHGASLQIQSEHLPKGPLAQATIYPAASIANFLRARVLVAKVLQIMDVTAFDEREIGYLTANAADFHQLNLSALPTQAADDSVPKAVALFTQFLTLADYASLRKNLAGGTDGLIDVFASVGAVFTEPAATHDANDNPAAPWKLLANLSRRDPQTIRDVALHFGLLEELVVGSDRQVRAVGDFANNQGIRRIWEALQLLQIVRVPVAALTAATSIVSAAPAAPDVIAGNLRNAVKAQYDEELWRPIAQSIFDKLRKRKRDSLTSYLVDHLDLDSSNQLFEYFLVDPGMEPVVQTSRLRLALSSVQTFIQRCLLNLENANNAHPERNVAPNVIDAEWWEWMKRYRVWEANRKIFLFPENWMEPELRLDKTDLFKALEGALLEGDITRDLVEDAFLTYLKGLEVRARLDVVSMYLDQDPTHLDISTLYVLGRTYGTPHKYFYRTYANGVWTGWEPVTVDIDGDHVTMAIWRGRLNLFWVTVINKVQTPPAPPAAKSGDPAAASLPFGTLAGRVYDGNPRVQIQMQLHWSEYLDGKWSARISTDATRYELIDVFDGFDPRRHIFIGVNKEMDAAGNEGAVLINLSLNLGGGNDYKTFRVTSKNCDPGFALYDVSGSSTPYNASGVDASARTGEGTLDATFETHITSSTSTWTTEHILKAAGSYSLLHCANPVSPPFISPTEPAYMEVGRLVSPFFFKDRSRESVPAGAFLDELTFFVQPSLTEKTIQEWDGYGISPAAPSKVKDPGQWDELIVPQFPWGDTPFPPEPDPESVFPVGDRFDWLTNPATLVEHGEAWIGRTGAQPVERLDARAGSQFVTTDGARLNGTQTIPVRALKGRII
jgi:hypothetical protein